MIRLSDLVAYTDDYLEAARFTDYCPNGLQVEGRAEVRRIVSGVTACLALLEAAAEAKADAVLVHHGYFWKGEDPRVVGVKQRRLHRLLGSGMSLLGYHLPLDAHPECGNNVLLGARLEIELEGRFEEGPGAGIACFGRLAAPLRGAEFAARVGAVLGRAPLHVSAGEVPLRRIGWCTGAAQDFIEQAAALGLDGYLSGEISERTVHSAREHGVHYFAAGHHATERLGVAALGEHLARRFGLQHRFIDIDNPA